MLSFPALAAPLTRGRCLMEFALMCFLLDPSFIDLQNAT